MHRPDEGRHAHLVADAEHAEPMLEEPGLERVEPDDERLRDLERLDRAHAAVRLPDAQRSPRR